MSSSSDDITLYSLQQELDSLKFDFLLSIIIIAIVLFLLLVLSIILYCWMYTLEKKLKKRNETNSPVEYKIKRAQIREENPISMVKPLPTSQNPLAKSGNFEAVVDDLKRSSNGHANSQPARYPNYIADNNNFNF